MLYGSTWGNTRGTTKGDSGSLDFGSCNLVTSLEKTICSHCNPYCSCVVTITT